MSLLTLWLARALLVYLMLAVFEVIIIGQTSMTELIFLPWLMFFEIDSNFEPSRRLPPVPPRPTPPPLPRDRPAIGAIGHAVTPLRPSGCIRVGGVKYDARSGFGYIDEGVAIRVVRCSSTAVVVEADSAKRSDTGLR